MVNSPYFPVMVGSCMSFRILNKSCCNHVEGSEITDFLFTDILNGILYKDHILVLCSSTSLSSPTKLSRLSKQVACNHSPLLYSLEDSFTEGSIVNTMLFYKGAQIPPASLVQPEGHGDEATNCHEKYGSVSFVKIALINLAWPGRWDDCWKISCDDTWI
jgi:hypothetical protein